MHENADAHPEDIAQSLEDHKLAAPLDAGGTVYDDIVDLNHPLAQAANSVRRQASAPSVGSESDAELRSLLNERPWANGIPEPVLQPPGMGMGRGPMDGGRRETGPVRQGVASFDWFFKSVWGSSFALLHALPSAACTTCDCQSR
jgi:hypothetical protein